MSAPEAPVIRLRGLSRTFPGTVEVHALRPVELDVREGEFLAVVGPSGSGKSTLLNLLGLLDRPTAGTYELGGIDVAGLGERRRTAVRGHLIGFVFQSFQLLPYRTATENVELAQLYVARDARSRRLRAVEALRRVGLEHRLDALPPTMSGGERQRVAIARALVNRPRLLLCDEPTGNLDSRTSEIIMELFEELHRSGQTIVIITHDPAVAARAGRTLVMRDGELGSTAETPA
ncbi:ABC transporter ATP-binding protein [Streptomyces gardneri]|uniref:Putative ABC transporter ATP-binding protein YvrO n=1 Tax=Streptomyces gardneri TaxID=66892 RepID=A0A4Y3RFD1_9ACTN|nr:ABC transporter ATP-binding protein [Streptomyces gardneri]ALO10552.1 Putative ABC transporter ATP-binding protein [Streptomyces venezuelae]QPK47543.1 ABC transporter ATP-binding protein [Streptomyces gardneri]WRK38981.1 ABC transporter ATP-binding protein [Streptomyces venezuelae]GEB56392.1 putative ABC transporter ATP-binding protein YvrO [Streptomyces gardneri]GHH11262.1 putative ABC transporter ATP-binding protein YvrO [Streptomyces gardneri]